MNPSKIITVVVAYFPDPKIVTKTIESIRAQVQKVFVVDNTPGGSKVFKNHNLFNNEGNVELITLNDNVGIARAQNIGIKKALNDGADFVLLSDQDTFYPDNYLTKMIEAYSQIPNNDAVAVVVPGFIDVNKKGIRGGFVMFDNNALKIIYPKSGCHEISQAIASGMIIPAKIFKSVGFMREDLFIDSVDIEWCWRARAKGYKIIGCADVVIEHYLAEKVVKWGRFSYDARSPTRDYYIVRNGIYLVLRSKNLSVGVRYALLKLHLKHLILSIVLGKPHFEHLKYSLAGFFHGIIGKLDRHK